MSLSFINKGLRLSFQQLLRELAIFRMHRRGVCAARRYRGQHHMRLHVGCGVKRKVAWINVDLNRHADMTLDLREPLPFADNSCTMIYSEHFLEHLAYPLEVTSFVRECWRVLEPGGVFSVGVPDTVWPLESYLQHSAEYFRMAKERWHPAWCRTEMEHINYHFRQDGEHRFAYDYKTLATLLGSGGFIDVQRREFDPELDSEEWEFVTIYVDARKPGETFE